MLPLHLTMISSLCGNTTSAALPSFDPQFFRLQERVDLSMSPPITIPGYLELRKDAWNKVVDDASQCMRVSPDEEIKYFSQRNENRKFASLYLLHAFF